VIATKKGVNILERGSQVHFMAEFQELLDFPPAPKLGSTASSTREASERSCAARRCSSARRSARPATRAVLHRQPDAQPARRALLQARDDQRHDGHADGPIKTFPLRGIKDSPPYLHDGGC
jgi:cytochrome c peroxidase